MESDNELIRISNEELTKAHEHLESQIAATRTMGIEGLQAAVASIDSIAETALATVKDNAEILARLNDGSDANLSNTLAMHDDRVTRFMQKVAEHSVRQVELAQQAVEYTSDIVSAAERINHVSRKSKLLALNAAIYTSHLKGRGSSLGVLAREMKEVSDEVASISDVVSTVAKALLEVLPMIVEGARTMRSKTESVSARLEETRGRFATDALKADEAVNHAVLVGEQRVNKVVEQAQIAHECLQVTLQLDEGFDQLANICNTMRCEVIELMQPDPAQGRLAALAS